MTALAQAFAKTDNPLREDLIRHQRTEHNYDSAHELLEELESDIATLQDLKSRMDTVQEQIQALRDKVQQGYYDVGSFEHYTRLWASPDGQLPDQSPDGQPPDHQSPDRQLPDQSPDGPADHLG